MSSLIPVHHLGLGPLRHYNRGARNDWGRQHTNGWRRPKNYNRDLTRRRVEAAQRETDKNETT